MWLLYQNLKYSKKIEHIHLVTWGETFQPWLCKQQIFLRVYPGFKPWGMEDIWHPGLAVSENVQLSIVMGVPLFIYGWFIIYNAKS